MKDTTTFTQVPHWLIAKGVTGNALRLYVAIGQYADRKTGKAWPTHHTLMKDLDVSRESIKKWVRELVRLGALTVEKRPRPDAPNRSNLYTLRLEPPVGDPVPRHYPLKRRKQGEGVQADPLGGTGRPPEQQSYEPEPSTSYTPKRSMGTPGDHSSVSDDLPGEEDLAGQSRVRARKALIAVGKALNEGHSFHDLHDPTVDTAWENFIDVLGSEANHLPYFEALMDLVAEKWKITGKVSDPYIAGTELNKMLATARC